MNEAERRRDARQDQTILRVGAALAIFAATGAASLALAPGGGLRSLERFAIFAQPSHGRAVARAASARPPSARPEDRDARQPRLAEAEPGREADDAQPSDGAEPQPSDGASEPLPPRGAPRFAAAATPSPRMRAPSRVAAGPDRMSVAAIAPADVIPPRVRSPFGEVRRAIKTPRALAGAAARTALEDWRIYDMVGDRALLAGPAGAHWIEAGVDLGAAGVVTRIVATRAGVRVVTSKGAIESQ